MQGRVTMAGIMGNDFPPTDHLAWPLGLLRTVAWPGTGGSMGQGTEAGG